VCSSCQLSRSEVCKDKVSKEFLEYVHVCEDKPDKSVRQVIEAVNSQIRLFNGVSRWRNITTLLAYLQGYAIGYSFSGSLGCLNNFSPEVYICG